MSILMCGCLECSGRLKAILPSGYLKMLVGSSCQNGDSLERSLIERAVNLTGYNVITV